MNGPLISDIIAAADIPSFPWTRSLIIIGVILFIGAFITAVVAVSSDYDRGYRLVFGLFITLVVAAFSLGINAMGHDVPSRYEGPIATELSEAYGVTILEDGGRGFGFLPTEPAQAREFNVLVDDVVLPCTIATSSDRYSISCEQGKDVVVLKPR